MNDYTWQSVYFAYLLFALFAGGAVYFFIRSIKSGYLGAQRRRDQVPDVRRLSKR